MSSTNGGPASDGHHASAMRVAISGAAGNVAYSLLPLISQGQAFGCDTMIDLNLIEIPGERSETLNAVAMEIQDCAFPLVRSITTTDKPKVGFKDADVAILIGGVRETPGMERKDLLEANARVFMEHGQALNEAAKRDVNVLIVANPVNTNALVAAENAPELSHDQFIAVSRIDQNRAVAYLAEKTCTPVKDIKRVTVWGNHSDCMFADLSNAQISGKPALDVIGDQDWVREKFIPKVQRRSEGLMRTHGKTSGLSAAVAVIDTLRDLYQGCRDNWSTMAVCSDGTHGIDEGIWFSVPCTAGNGKFKRVEKVASHDQFATKMIEKNKKELLQQRDEVREILSKS